MAPLDKSKILIGNDKIALKLEVDNFGRSESINKLDEVFDAYNAPDERQKKHISRRIYVFLARLPESIALIKDPQKREELTKWQRKTINEYFTIMGTYGQSLPEYRKGLDSHKRVYIPNTDDYTRIWDETTSLQEQQAVVESYIETMKSVVLENNKEISHQK